jgi:hypothetical protein
MKDWDDSSPLAGTSRHDVKGLRGRCRVDRVFMQAVVTDRRFLLHYCGNPLLIFEVPLRAMMSTKSVRPILGMAAPPVA